MGWSIRMMSKSFSSTFRKCRPSRKSTEAGWIMKSSHGSTVSSPLRISSRMVASDRIMKGTIPRWGTIAWGSGQMAFHFLVFLAFFAGHAQGRDGPGLQPLGADGFLADLADTEGTVVDARQRFLDLGAQLTLPVANPQG